MAEQQIIPLSEGQTPHTPNLAPIDPSTDALNRFRITHSDRDLRPLLRRLHRFPHLRTIPPGPNAPSEEGADEPPIGHSEPDVDRERDMIRMELLKWRAGVERMLGSVRNLERQRATYVRRAAETGQCRLPGEVKGY